jgi:methanogenic corrinoid protein MtbC1
MASFDFAPLDHAMTTGDIETTRAEVRAALAAGVAPLEIITQSCQPCMDEVGRLFHEGDFFLPDLILAGRAMSAAMEVLLPALRGSPAGVFAENRVVLGTVEGDLHDIGKNLVGTLIAVAGFQVTDLGINVPTKKLLTTALDLGASIIGASSLLTTSSFYQRDLIERACRMGVRERFYFIVGGGSVTTEFVRLIRADGWARSAAGAGELCKRLIQDGLPPPLAEPVLIDR